jgi:putative FmdB family regulatory protein
VPIYEYRCADCGHQQEFLQKAADAPLTVCTKCGKDSFSKLLSAPGFQLKGSGWYATDFKNKGGSSTAKADAKKDSGGSSEGGDGGKQAASAACGTNCGCH